MKNLLFVSLLIMPSGAFAGGFEFIDQSPVGVGTAGAQAAAADDPSAVYYNPAGLAFQKGLGIIVGGKLIYAVTQTTPPTGQEVTSVGIGFLPTIYLAQRVGSYVAVGLGVFSNFAHQITDNDTWVGRTLGTYTNTTAVTINPSVALRPISRLSIGFGLDITPATFELRQAIDFGGGEGKVHVGLSTTGLGGNVGVLAVAVPRYLQIGVTYRSEIGLDYAGQAAVTLPPELAVVMPGAQAIQRANMKMTLPHNFTFALASRPVPHLKITADVHLTLWHQLGVLDLRLTPPTGSPVTQSLVVNFQDSIGIRVGGEYRFLENRLRIRAGIGYDPSPAQTKFLTPLAPDADRIMVGIGLGYQSRIVGFDVGYLPIVLLTRASTLPALPATYSSVEHVISVGINVNLEKIGPKIKPAFAD